MKMIQTVLFTLFVALFVTCEADEHYNYYSGITETSLDSVDINGNPVGTIMAVDEDDWRLDTIPPIISDTGFISPPSVERIGPAFPNPTTVETFIEVIWGEPNVLNMYVKNDAGEFVKVLYSDTLQPGYYFKKISWDLRDEKGEQVPSGIYRCYYDWEIFSRKDSAYHRIKGYGDIQVK